MMKDTRTDEELNGVIARWCPDVVEQFYGPCGTNDFCSDLNAIHEAEGKLGNGTLGSEYDKFEIQLAEVCYQEGIRRNMIYTEARQRAEALVYVIEHLSK